MAVPVDEGGHPLYIPADDGGTWNLIQGSSCPITTTETTTAQTPAVASSYVPLAVAAIGGLTLLAGLI